MQTLTVFQNVTLDGYFVDGQGSMEWAKQDNDPEFNGFADENAKGGGTLVFGRVTYDMMAGFWTSPQAAQMMPDLARHMNEYSKIVFSRTLDKAAWKNTTLIKGDLVAEMRRLKEGPGQGLVILGSGSLVAQLAGAGLIDEYQMVMIPVVLGKGRTMFEGLKQALNFKLVRSRVFKSGKVFLCYQPVK